MAFLNGILIDQLYGFSISPEIVPWKLENYTDPEIAARLDCRVRKVERKLERIRAHWETKDA